jgi:hypothetical protein
LFRTQQCLSLPRIHPIPFFRNQNTHHRVAKGSAQAANLSQLNPSHSLTPYRSLAVYWGSHLCLSFQSSLFSPGILSKIVYELFTFYVRATCSAHLTLLNSINLIIRM